MTDQPSGCRTKKIVNNTPHNVIMQTNNYGVCYYISLDCDRCFDGVVVFQHYAACFYYA